MKWSMQDYGSRKGRVIAARDPWFAVEIEPGMVALCNADPRVQWEFFTTNNYGAPLVSAVIRDDMLVGIHKDGVVVICRPQGRDAEHFHVKERWQDGGTIRCIEKMPGKNVFVIATDLGTLSLYDAQGRQCAKPLTCGRYIDEMEFVSDDVLLWSNRDGKGSQGLVKIDLID